MTPPSYKVALALALFPAISGAGNSRLPQQTKVIGSSPTDLAPIAVVAAGVPQRLRRTDEEQPGEEMAQLAMFGDGVHGLVFSMSTDLVDPAAPTVSHLAATRVQLALVPFALVKKPDGTIAAQPDFTGVTATGITNTAQTGGARFVTANQGTEFRNANRPSAYAIADGKAICVEYNYQPNNDTQRYMQCFNSAGATVMAQTQIYAKENDDCSNHQDKSSTWVIDSRAEGTSIITRAVAWRGCNGNGVDDGWVQGMELSAKVDGAGKVTVVTFQQTSDVSLCALEEGSRGFCSTAAADPNTAICSWTEGNEFPLQREGVWLAAIDLTKTGPASILWKQQIEGKKTPPGGPFTWAVQAMHDRVFSIDRTTQKRVASDTIIWRSADARRTAASQEVVFQGNVIAIIKADKAGMTYVIPKTDLASRLTGLDEPRLGMTSALFGTTDAPQVGAAFLSGTNTGTDTSSQIRTAIWDRTANMLVDGGGFNATPYDHLYSNYLGNNPGTKRRNFSSMDFIKNPFASGAAGEDAWLLIAATTGKPPEEVPSAACLDCAKKKLAAYITVVPVLETGSGDPTTPPPDGDSGGGGGSSDSGQQGGCSTGTGASTAIALFIGIVAIRRRRR